MSSPQEDTIAAIATPYGEGGIGIVRISGPQALQIAQKVFRPRRPPYELTSHQVRYGDVIDPSTGEVIDEALLTYMKAPRTYTREDVVEISCHGGYLVLERVLEVVLREGARGAGPGEFTRRAFLSGRIDLAQAEAVLEIVQAKTREGLRLAHEQLRGRLSREVEALRREVVEILVPIEAYIDFPEEDIEPPPQEGVREGIERVIGRVRELISGYEEGEIWRGGVKVVIVGKPNVGKSSLLNRLLERRRAIVTPIPGTTTDVIEETVVLEGVPLRIADMAGLGRARGPIEEEGVRLAEEKLREAHLVLLMVDRSAPLEEEDREIFRLLREEGKSSLLVLNKADLPPAISPSEVREEAGVEDLFVISALRGEGIEELKRGMVRAIKERHLKRGEGELVPVNLRHRRILEELEGVLQGLREGLDRGIPWDIVAIELRRGLSLLGEIVGETTPEEVLDMIFSRFCIGK